MTKDEARRMKSSCKKGYALALRAAAREVRAKEREALKAERAALRVRQAEEKAFLKAEGEWHAQRQAEGRLIDLPAVVLRDGTVQSVSLIQAVEIADSYADRMCLDVETSGYDLGHSKFELRTIQVGGEEMAVVLDALDPLQREIASYALKSAKILHAHSAMADLSPSIKAGLIGFKEAWGKMVDSVILAKLTDPKMSGSDANGLKDLAHDLLREYATAPAAEKEKNALFRAMGCLIDTKSDTPPERNGWYMVNRFSETMIRYAGSDVLDLAAVIRMLPELPVDESVLNRERKYQEICAALNLYGFALDRDHVKSKIEEHESSKSEHLSNIYVLSNGKIGNPSSPDVGQKILEMYPDVELAVSDKTGKPSASKNSLSAVKGNGTESGILADQILGYRHDVTTLGLLLRPLETLCDEGDGRMRPTTLTINADTGRSSMVRPNGQQFSRQGGIRKCVVADPGYVRFNADFSGCEIRVAAALSGDWGLLEAETSSMCHLCKSDPCSCGKKHTGLHWLAAHLTFGEEAVKEHRYKSKAVIFRKLFGGAPDSEVAQQIADTFDTKIAPVYKAWDDWLRKCWYDGRRIWRDFSDGENYSLDIPGQRRYAIYQTFNGRQIYATKGAHATGNYAIQGTARELLVEALVRFWADVEAHPEWGVTTVAPIHDEVLGFCREEHFEAVTASLQRAMTVSDLSVPGHPVVIECDPELTPATYWEDSS